MNRLLLILSVILLIITNPAQAQAQEDLFEQGLDAFEVENFDTAFKHFLKASKQGNIEATYWVGQMHAHGIGRTKNIERAYKYLSQGYIQNHGNSAYALAKLFEGLNSSDEGVKSSIQSFLIMSANHGHKSAKVEAGERMIVDDGPGMGTAMEFLIDAADNDKNPKAMGLLAQVYNPLNERKKWQYQTNQEKAFKYARLATKNDDPQGKFELCMLIILTPEQKTEADIDEPIQLCQEASQAGIPYAQFVIALQHAEGLNGFDKNSAEAMKWFLLAERNEEGPMWAIFKAQSMEFQQTVTQQEYTQAKAGADWWEMAHYAKNLPKDKGIISCVDLYRKGKPVDFSRC